MKPLHGATCHVVKIFKPFQFQFVKNVTMQPINYLIYLELASLKHNIAIHDCRSEISFLDKNDIFAKGIFPL